MWEELLYDKTPVERHGGILFKREDKFAPLGLGNINGSKLRQAIHLIHLAKKKGHYAVISGSVADSPQHPMIAEICRHYNMQFIMVTGQKDPNQNEMTKWAMEAGAVHKRSPIAYAKGINSICRKFAEARPGIFHLETNITTSSDIKMFHDVGAEQVRNIPAEVRKLYVPAGSCNSLTSIVHGLHSGLAPQVREVVVLGIGNEGSKGLGYLRKRLGKVQKCMAYKEAPQTFSIKHIDCYAGSRFTYKQLISESESGIAFHPRYEAKAVRYMKQKGIWERLRYSDSLFWIIGSEPKNQPTQ